MTLSGSNKLNSVCEHCTNINKFIRRALLKAGIVALVLGSCLVVSRAQQQAPEELAEKSIEQLMNIKVATVYSASKYWQKVTDAPSSVSIVTSDDIEKYGYRTLADILHSVRGFYSTSDRNYSYLGVRGFARPGDYNTRILLLIDGHRINDNVYDQAMVGRELPIDVDLIERVEIVRGPSSSLYGASAFFGVINVITKRGHDINGTQVSGDLASFGTHSARLTYGNQFKNGLEALVSASYFDSQGHRKLYYKEFDSPSTNNGIAENGDDEKIGNLFTSLSFHNVTARATYGSREKAIPTASFGTIFNDPRNRTYDRRGYVDLNYQKTFANQWGVSARVSYDSYHYDGDYIFDYSDNGSLVVNKDFSRAEWWGGELQLTRKLARNHRVTFGAEYRDNRRQDQSNYDEDPKISYIDDRRQSKNRAFYFQDEFTINEKLSLSAGVRYDHSTFGGTTKPRLGLIFHPTEKTTFKFLYGEAFRAPNNYELYYGAAVTFKTNHDLKPETIRTTEVVWEQYFGNRVRLSASGYVYRIKGLISQQTDPIDNLISFRNVQDVGSKGLELELETKLPSGLEGRMGYTLQNTQDRLTKQVLTNSPKQLGKFNLSIPFAKRAVFANVELQYTSKRMTLDGSDTAAVWLPNFTLLSRNLLKGADVSVGVYNIFDRKYGDPGAEEHRQNTIEQNGRNFRLKFTYKF